MHQNVHCLEEICGDYSGEDTPVPIPNTEVKLLSADDTWRATSWESKTLPLISFFVSFYCVIVTAEHMLLCYNNYVFLRLITRMIDDVT